MEVLTRKLKLAQREDCIRGVRLAPHCPILTHVIYADGLILLGNAEETEVEQLNRIMEEFGMVSGLVINPTKSKIWFSKKCDDQVRQLIHNTLRAGTAEDEERYLGALLTKANCAKKTGTMLLERLKAKLTGWSSNMLSHAGQLVLIKSVLLSIPVFFMSVEIIPRGLIKQMESPIAKFFWGKTDQHRYMSFVSWAKICQTTNKGGLGVRQLRPFGDALFLKLVWDMMREENKIWVQVCSAKYYANFGFWRANCVAGTSSLWRQTVKLRDFFKENVKWQLGDGEKVKVLSQPWHPSWQICAQATRKDRKSTVATLFDFEAGEWNSDKVTSLLKVNAWVCGDARRIKENQPAQFVNELIPYEFVPQGWQIIVDASWDTSYRAGGAYLAYHAGVLDRMKMENYESADTFHAEALALNVAVNDMAANLEQQGSLRL
ncbi:RNA-directed DNA polymerase (reverse transcriptase)-related family protein [Rhynchospora pubera]|uniref:RNA-directed DNA polymerase (Reverse transcriptase)-related family protein n=1 Tax=Rhynchospora pubera TaxID=906938 RepID=A0AAV8EY66_9POAL|nr:RNA-directed DNA polymerase (reverse transcriptase)-related family protein [Rhynchospora pubera]